jgi:hypothetical protein
MLRGPANQSLEIGSFREGERGRMIRALRESPQDLSFTPRIKGSISHNLLKEVRRNQP